MTRELRYAVATLRRRPLVALLAWSVPEALPAAASGLAIARAVDTGFLAGRPDVGLAWLGALLVAAVAGAAGSRGVYRRLGDLVEPMRDDLVRRVVDGALRQGVAGRPDDGAVARLTRQVEIVRDTYAGLIVVVRGFAVTVAGVVLGLLSVAPAVAVLVLVPFALGVAGFLATLGLAATRQRASVRADERLAAAAGGVLAGVRDITARGAEKHAAAMVAGPIGDQAAAERALARVAAVRAVCFAVGGWLPLVVVLAAGPWLVDRGVTAGAVMGGLTYVLFGLQPALSALMSGLGGSGLRFVVTLHRLLDASAPHAQPPRSAARAVGRAPVGPVTTSQVTTSRVTTSQAAVGRATVGESVMGWAALVARGVTFAYGTHAAPVLRGLDLSVAPGDHLAVLGPSGIGKSTLAGLLCGMLRPDAGTVHLGGVPATEVPPDRRVLIPQEAYVFAGTVWDNLTYLRPAATRAHVDAAVAAVGARDLVTRLGGVDATLRPAELSAGERQLLALTRAYLSAAPLAVLDEATCHLDPAAECRAERAFARRGTLVVIAHRISSALRAPRILVLDGARAAAGDRATLLATSPLFRELVSHWTGEDTACGAGRPAGPVPTAP